MPSCVFFSSPFLFLVFIMVVPYSNRTVVATLPSLALALKPATVKEVIADLALQCPHESVLECVQLIKGRTLRIVFPSTDVMEDIVTGGLAFRSHQIVFKTPSVYKWVTLMDLPYGIPESEIKTALSRFGQTAHVKSESYMGLYTGTRLVKIEIKKAIPSRVMVAGHLCTVFYRGQMRSCFRCGQPGHEAKSCPSKTSAPPDGGRQREEEHVPPSRDKESPRGEGMSTDPPSSPKTFAEVVISPGTKGSPPVKEVTTHEGMNTTPPTSPPDFPSVTDSEWTDTEGSVQSQTQTGITTDENIRDRSPLSKLSTSSATATPTSVVPTIVLLDVETPTSAVPTIVSPDIFTSGNDETLHSAVSSAIPDGQPPRQLADEPSYTSNSGTVWTDWVVDVSPEIQDAQPKKQLTEDLPSMDTSTPPSDSGASSAKVGSLKTRRRAHYPVHQKGKLASCIRQRTAPTLPGKRKAKCRPPPDPPYTPLVTDSGYLVTTTPGGTSPGRPKRPDTGAVGAISPSPSSDTHP